MPLAAPVMTATLSLNSFRAALKFGYAASDSTEEYLAKKTGKPQ
jgi:hypothetical protein